MSFPRFLPAATLALTAGALACGGKGEMVLLNGAGATFPNIIYQKWITDYNTATPDVKLNYQSIGSGGGIQQYPDGTVDFGASDAPMTEEEMAKVEGNVLHIPMVLGAVVPTYNLPEVTEPIRFAPEALAGIYLGEITRWNDVRLRSTNPGLTLPDREIVVVRRSDGSGTTYIWTEFLSAVCPDWLAKVGTGKSVNWPVGGHTRYPGRPDRSLRRGHCARLHCCLVPHARRCAMVKRLRKSAFPRWRKRNEGQAIVEFALIAPIFLLMVFGVVEFGRAWNVYQTLTDAAREVARLAVVGDPTIILESQVTDRVKEKIARGGFDTSQVEVEYPDGFHEGTGKITSVQVSMPYRFVVLHRLASLVTDNGVITLGTTARMRNE